jgi:hypothetical protein
VDPTIIAAILNGSALAILAYHFLIGLPAILERISKDQQAERVFWAGEAQLDRQAFAERAAMIAAELRERNEQLDKLAAVRQDCQWKQSS